MKAVRIMLLLFHEMRRWRNRHNLPQLTAEIVQTPYWGGVELPVLVRNTGKTAARDCRYCRRQRFTMDHGQVGGSVTAVTWYATGSFRVPAGGSGVQQVAYTTTDPCPRVVLGDISQGTSGSRFEAALVCRDRFGTFYRFRFADGREPETDAWRPSPLTRMRHQQPPEWTRWVSLPEQVANREWTARFA